VLEGETLEHYPDLYDFHIEKKGDAYLLHNVTADKREETFENLGFHGGPGSTLVMRVFTLPSLLKSLRLAGFERIEILDKPHLPHGIYHPEGHSLPLLAFRGEDDE
jgi:hypothetical protein